MAVASKAQRAVTDVAPGRWAEFGKALQARREDELGYETRVALARDSDVNIRLLQDLEKNYRPGTYTKWALQDAEKAYKVTYESMLAFLHGETGTLVPAETAALLGEPAVIGSLGLPPSPFDPARTAADHPYAAVIWKHFLDLPRRITDPSGVQMFPGDTDDARAWDDFTRFDIGDRVWFIADLRRRAAGRDSDSSAGTGA